MKNLRTCLTIFFSVSSCLYFNSSYSGEFSGYVGVETRNFFKKPQDSKQHNNYLSAVTEPEYSHEWDNGTQFFDAKLFYRVDQYDKERTHGDIRELAWTGVFNSDSVGDWELLAGISKVYWGVAETQHLVDIVNQTDQVENIDGEDKLGQPMLKASTERDWGTLDFLVLPGFRERTFPGVKGRPRPGIVIDTGKKAIYDFNGGKNHVDFAARYSHYIDEFEFAVFAFSGIDREPTDFRPVKFNSTTGQPTAVVPVYSLVNQVGLEGQAFFGDWTWKLEALNTEVRSGDKDGVTSFKSVSGFEYTLVGLADSVMDLGFIVEYHYSDKDIRNTIFDNDIATALRFVFNDAQSSEILLGLTTDTSTNTVGTFLEASTRLGQSWTLEAQVRTFHGTETDRPMYSFRFDHFAQVDLQYHF